jgi:hypothetical protein
MVAPPEVDTLLGGTITERTAELFRRNSGFLSNELGKNDFNALGKANSNPFNEPTKKRVRQVLISL